MFSKKTFNIRVYGLLIIRKRVLVIDEIVKGKKVTKFPGGGLEFGEGIKDCLIREFYEETGNEVIIDRLFYLTDYFQESMFRRNEQLVSIYYKVKSTTKKFEINPPEIDEFADYKEDILGFRWIHINELSTDDFNLPIDQIVAMHLIEGKRSAV